jgi:DNA mismatch endonuclease (patch repair protein)
MADIVDKATRSRIMAAIPSRDTRPEAAVRKGLHTLGLRQALRAYKLPGKPDIVYPKHRSAIFVHGCFWHGHGCHFFKWPKTNTEFWTTKILSNMNRDSRSCKELRKLGWNPVVVWECRIRKAEKTGKMLELLAMIRDRIRNGRKLNTPARQGPGRPSST